MTILYAVADGTGATYHSEEAHLYDWFKDEEEARRFAGNPQIFDSLREGTIPRFRRG